MYKTFHKNEDSRGIGLFITKNQIEAMGGRVEAKSEVDKGSVFSIILKKNHSLSAQKICPLLYLLPLLVASVL